MDNLKINKLKDQIWVTRISRVNAEARLQNKEKFVQGINVYYSCVTIVYSILSYVNHDDSLSLVTIFYDNFIINYNNASKCPEF